MALASESGPGQWYAVHTRARHERIVADELRRRKFEVFLAQYQTWSTRRDRRKRLTKPLFPGYVFVHSEMLPEQRIGILQTRSVARIVGRGAHPVPIPAHEIESVRLLIAGASDAGPHQPIREGLRVQIMDGPLRSVVGRVISSPRGKRIVVEVELLGRAVAASLDTDALVPYLD
jgi:transcriptional antiterminator NusG